MEPASGRAAGSFIWILEDEDDEVEDESYDGDDGGDVEDDEGDDAYYDHEQD